MKLNLERMRAALREAADVATNALEHQPEATGECWRHLSAAVGKVHQATRLGWANLVEYDKADRKDETIAGNAAAMREALKNVRKVAVEMARGYSAEGAYDRMVIDGWAERLSDIVDAALSAPPRNCDRFKTREEARNFFDNFVCLRSNGSGAIDCKGCPIDSIDNPHRADCREAWLFAPAAERKGEGK